MDEFDGSRAEQEAREATIGRPARLDRTAPPSTPARIDGREIPPDPPPSTTAATDEPPSAEPPPADPPQAAGSYAPPPMSLPPPRVEPLAPIVPSPPPVALPLEIVTPAAAAQADLPTSRADLPEGVRVAIAALAPLRLPTPPPPSPEPPVADRRIEPRFGDGPTSSPARAPLLVPAPAPATAPASALPTAASDIAPEQAAANDAVRGTRSVWRWGWRIAAGLAALFVGWSLLVVAQIVLYRSVDPPTSNLMLMYRLSGEVVVQKWLPIERVPAQLVRAIVVSEDGRFCVHNGIDFREIEAALERARETDGTPRGASTITMQVAKNLFLWPSKSYVRKALEVPITLLIEALWTKRRIFEVYVNIAEWGPGVFGAEAAAGYHFGKSASRVSEREAALLAVALPNPVTRDAGDPGPGTERLASIIQARMRAMSRAATCIERPGAG